MKAGALAVALLGCLAASGASEVGRLLEVDSHWLETMSRGVETPRQICERLEVLLDEVPLKDPPLTDQTAYGRLRRGALDAAECLADRIPDQRVMRDPFFPARRQNLEIGVVALLLLIRFDFFELDDVLPAVRDDAAGEREKVREGLRDPLEAERIRRTCLKRIREPSRTRWDSPRSIWEATALRDRHLESHEFPDALRLTQLLSDSGGGFDESLNLQRIRLRWFSESSGTAGAVTRDRAIVELEALARLARHGSNENQRSVGRDAAKILAIAYQSGLFGIERAPGNAACWNAIAVGRPSERPCEEFRSLMH